MTSPLSPTNIRGRQQDLALRLRALIDAELASAVELRHALHQSPEIAHGEHETGRMIAAMLPVASRAIAGTGVFARLGPDHGAPIIVRAELDALPIAEQTTAPFRARNGAMHACGHDINAASLVALCRAAAQLADELPRPLIALFQPSEEAYPSGAQAVIASGALDAAEAIVAAHLHPEIAWGSVALDAGAVNASSDTVEILIVGVPAHGAYPHLARDPILALADTVCTLHASIGRRIDPLAGAVLTVGMISAGHTENVIPGEAMARLTLRALDPDVRIQLRSMVDEVVGGVAAAHGCRARIDLTRGAPALVNDAALVACAHEQLGLYGLSRAPTWRSCGADDFSFFGEMTRNAMAFVGLNGAPEFVTRPLHHPEFLPPDAAIGPVARTQAALYLAACRSTGESSVSRSAGSPAGPPAAQD